MSDEETVKAKFPSSRLIGPSGDGCHIDVDGKWMGFGNIPENAWADAARRLTASETAEKL